MEHKFVISYSEFERSDFHQIPLFNDALLLEVSKNHPRIGDTISSDDLFNEAHAIVALNEKDLSANLITFLMKCAQSIA